MPQACVYLAGCCCDGALAAKNPFYTPQNYPMRSNATGVRMYLAGCFCTWPANKLGLYICGVPLWPHCGAFSLRRAKHGLCAARQQALAHSRMFLCGCTCGVLSEIFFLRSNLSRTNSAAGVCTYLATHLCAGKDVFVLTRFPPACSGPQFLLPFCSPVPAPQFPLYFTRRLGLHWSFGNA